MKGYLSDATSTPAAYKDPLNKHSMASPQSTITVAWNAAADFETNLERIITQKWIAIFPLGPRRGQNTAVRVIPVCCQPWWITAVAP